MNIKILKAGSKQGFTVLEGINRKIVPSHVTKMHESIKKLGVIRPVIVSNINFSKGKTETYIIDGQHLYHACLRENIDIPYVEITITNEKELIETLAMLNNSSKSWKLTDYIDAWAWINPQYRILNRLFETYDIELSTIAEILQYGGPVTNAYGGSRISRLIKTGQFDIADLAKGETLLKWITDSLGCITRLDRLSNKAFIASYCNYISSLSTYNHSEFLIKLKANNFLFKMSTQDPEEFRKCFKQIYK